MSHGRRRKIQMARELSRRERKETQALGAIFICYALTFTGTNGLLKRWSKNISAWFTLWRRNERVTHIWPKKLLNRSS